MKKFLVLLLGSVLLFTSCKESTVAPMPVQNPPGYQVDISWPSLADSPWPMNHHDPQNTGRSKYAAPAIGQLIGKIPANVMECGVSLFSDSIAIVASNNTIFAVKPSGDTVWKYPYNYTHIYTTPLVGSDGTVYFADYGVYAIDKNGNLKWKYSPVGIDVLGLSLSIDKSGNILAYDNFGNLYVIDTQGNLLSKSALPDFFIDQDNLFVFSPDGKTIYYKSFNTTITAFDPSTKTVLWTYGAIHIPSAPLVDADGNIYFNIIQQTVSTAKYVCLTPSGLLKWEFEYLTSSHGFTVNVNGSIDKLGNIVFGTDTIYSLSYTGKLRWKKYFSGFYVNSPLITDKNGSIIAGMDGPNRKILCLDTNGNTIWELNDSSERETGFSPALSSTGTLYYPMFRSKNVFVIK